MRVKADTSENSKDINKQKRTFMNIVSRVQKPCRRTISSQHSKHCDIHSQFNSDFPNKKQTIDLDFAPENWLCLLLGTF